MTAALILAKFPNLQAGFSITSPLTPNYNCIGWAANDDAHFWWPSLTLYWPIPHNSIPSVAIFEDAFAGLGYTLKGLDDSFDPNVEKVAIYVEPSTGLVTHMARQLATGRWTSKLGSAHDIEHLTVHCLNGVEYGVYSHCLGRTR